MAAERKYLDFGIKSRATRLKTRPRNKNADFLINLVSRDKILENVLKSWFQDFAPMPIPKADMSKSRSKSWNPRKKCRSRH